MRFCLTSEFFVRSFFMLFVLPAFFYIVYIVPSYPLLVRFDKMNEILGRH